MKSSLILLLLFFISPAFANEKILIITHSYNQPDFIEFQEKTFKKFLDDSYDFVIFNDARTDAMANQIQKKCEQLNLLCIRVPQNIHTSQNPSDRHADCIQYSLEKIGFARNGIVVLIDSDMFPIKSLSIKDYLNEYDIAANKQQRGHINYLSPALVFLNMPNLPNKETLNFITGRIEGNAVDTGGHTYFYLKNNPSVVIKYFSPTGISTLPHEHVKLRELGFNDIFISFLEKILSITNGKTTNLECDNYFLHYSAGSNWPGYQQDAINNKMEILHNFIDALVNSNE